MSPNFKCFLGLCLITLAGCTSVTVNHPNGTVVEVRKFHPMGEELTIDGTLDDFGTLSINKSTEDSQATADALLQGILRAANP